MLGNFFIRKIQDGRQGLYNKKTNNADFYICQIIKKLEHHIIWSFAKFHKNNRKTNRVTGL